MGAQSEPKQAPRRSQRASAKKKTKATKAKKKRGRPVGSKNKKKPAKKESSTSPSKGKGRGGKGDPSKEKKNVSTKKQQPVAARDDGGELLVDWPSGYRNNTCVLHRFPSSFLGVSRQCVPPVCRFFFLLGTGSKPATSSRKYVPTGSGPKQKGFHATRPSSSAGMSLTNITREGEVVSLMRAHELANALSVGMKVYDLDPVTMAECVPFLSSDNICLRY